MENEENNQLEEIEMQQQEFQEMVKQMNSYVKPEDFTSGYDPKRFGEIYEGRAKARKSIDSQFEQQKAFADVGMNQYIAKHYSEIIDGFKEDGLNYLMRGIFHLENVEPGYDDFRNSVNRQKEIAEKRGNKDEAKMYLEGIVEKDDRRDFKLLANSFIESNGKPFISRMLMRYMEKEEKVMRNFVKKSGEEDMKKWLKDSIGKNLENPKTYSIIMDAFNFQKESEKNTIEIDGEKISREEYEAMLDDYDFY